MNVLFYHSDEYKKNYTPNDLAEDIWAAYTSIYDNVIGLKFKCIVDFGYPQKMSIRIIEPDGVPYCTIHTDYQEYEILKYVCNYIIFEKDELVLEEDE
jgi:hypothetical protein